MTARVRNKREARVYADARLRQFLTQIIGDSVRYMHYASRNTTVTHNDVVHALKRNNIFLPPALARQDNREHHHQHGDHDRDRHRDRDDGDVATTGV
jgi:hypothetical protein